MAHSNKLCEKHGFVRELIVIEGTEFWICQQCSEEDEETNAKKSEQDLRRKRQELINDRLDNAMISPRFKDRTFDNFKTIGPGHEKAVKTALWFLDNIDDSTGLLLIGSPGTGKNHLASAIIQEAIKKHGKTALFTEAIKIVRAIKESWRREDVFESDILRAFIAPDVLAIDEVGVQFGSETEQMYLTEIINDRYNHKKPTILMANLTIEELKDVIGERPLDRFREGGRVIKFEWESYRKEKAK